MIPPIPAMRYPALADPPAPDLTPYDVVSDPAKLAACRVKLLSQPLPNAWDATDVARVAYPFDAPLGPGARAVEALAGYLVVLQVGVKVPGPDAGDPVPVYGVALVYEGPPAVVLGNVDCPVPYLLRPGDPFAADITLVIQVAGS